MTKLVGIAGPSCSGKSTLCKMDTSFQTVHFDDYYKEKGIVVENGRRNFEHPDNFNFDELRRDLEKIKSGKPRRVPIFDKVRFKRIGYREIDPDDVVLSEGFLLFYDKDIRNLLDVKIYIDVDKEIQRKRRESKYGHFKNGYFDDFVLPSYRKFGEPTGEFADFELDGSKPFNELQKEFENIIRQVA